MPNIPNIAGDEQRVYTQSETTAHTHDGNYHHHFGEIVIAGGATFDHLIRVPAGVYPEMVLLSFDTDNLPLTIRLYEAPTITAVGVLHGSYNMKRYSPKVSSLLLYHGPTVTAVGTLLDGLMLVGSKNSGSTGGGQDEWMFKPATDYLVRLTNGAVGAANVMYTLGHIESNAPFPDRD